MLCSFPSMLLWQKGNRRIGSHYIRCWILHCLSASGRKRPWLSPCRFDTVCLRNTEGIEQCLPSNWLTNRAIVVVGNDIHRYKPAVLSHAEMNEISSISVTITIGTRPTGLCLGGSRGQIAKQVYIQWSDKGSPPPKKQSGITARGGLPWVLRLRRRFLFIFLTKKTWGRKVKINCSGFRYCWNLGTGSPYTVLRRVDGSKRKQNRAWYRAIFSPSIKQLRSPKQVARV